MPVIHFAHMIGTWIILFGVALLIPTAYAGYIGAPYAPTRMASVRKTFSEIEVDKDDLVVDLGAGDGSILIEAARRGARAVGYELSPILYVVAWLRTRKYKNITLHYGNFFKKELPQDMTIAFLFLMPKHMDAIQDYLVKRAGNKLHYILSFAFPFKTVAPLATIKEKKCPSMYVYTLEGIRGQAV